MAQPVIAHQVLIPAANIVINPDVLGANQAWTNLRAATVDSIMYTQELDDVVGRTSYFLLLIFVLAGNVSNVQNTLIPALAVSLGLSSLQFWTFNASK